MVLNKTIIYAVSCLYHLNNFCKDEWCDIYDISKSMNIPYAYCNKIMQKLASNKIVKSKKGYGFKLLKNVEDLSLGDIFEIFNGQKIKFDKTNDKVYKISKKFFVNCVSNIRLSYIFSELDKRK